MFAWPVLEVTSVVCSPAEGDRERGCVCVCEFKRETGQYNEKVFADFCEDQKQESCIEQRDRCQLPV